MSSKFTRNSEAFASEFLENPEEMSRLTPVNLRKYGTCRLLVENYTSGHLFPDCPQVTLLYTCRIKNTIKQLCCQINRTQYSHA